MKEKMTKVRIGKGVKRWKWGRRDRREGVERRFGW